MTFRCPVKDCGRGYREADHIGRDPGTVTYFCREHDQRMLWVRDDLLYADEPNGQELRGL